MSKLEVDKIDPQSGTDLELGTSGDTITIPTGVTLDASNATTTLPANVVTTDGTQTLTNKTIDASQLSGTITPSDGTVTNAKVNASAAIDYSKLNLTGNIALADLSATGTKDATTFLRGDNTFDVPPLGGITMIDQWRIIADANYAGGTNDITGTWERNDTDGAGLLGSAMSVSSGVFTFPSTGYYYITAGFFLVRDNTTSRFNVLGIRTTQNNSSYNDRVQLGNHVEDIAVQHTFVYADYIFDVTDTSTHKAKFVLENDGSITLGGDTSKDRSFVRFIRLGDT